MYQILVILGKCIFFRLRYLRPAKTQLHRHPHDDQRFDAVQQNGNPAILTPNLDRLVKKGKRFTNAHVVFSLCSPSRAAILTGRYGSANGVLELDNKLNLDEKTIPNYLREAGYFTGVSGKWHVDRSPQELGFDFATTFHGNGT